MRTIKFRAWDIKNKRFWHDVEQEYDGLGRDDNEYNWQVSSFADYLDDPDRYDVQQYTGLKDKNGKEIYEGDIITLTGISIHGPEEVSFDYGAFGINGTSFCYGQEELNWEDFKVIGNIYENKDLLN
jgi:uncharacterized phage protein (TIGR01671 family)